MNMKRLTVGFLTAVLALSSVGCSSLTGGKTKSSELTLWYESATVKLLQNDEGKAAKTAKDKQTLKVNMARNESEGVQLMMYAKKDIDAYNVTISDLVSGTSIIPADTVDIYQTKYLPVAGNGAKNNPDFASGEIPDALLPMETAVEYKENRVEAGKNQSIYIDVTTESSTPAGVYTGAVTLETEENTYKMPIEVTVYDVALPDTADLITAFSFFNRDHFASAELDATDEQTTAYFETLLDYNMSSFLPFEGVGGVEAYTELLRKYYDYPGFNSYRLFYQTAATPYGQEIATYNATSLKEYIKAIVDISIEDKRNYLDKAYTYLYTVADEPQTDEQFETARKSLATYEKMLKDADEEMRAKYAGTSEYAYYMDNISETLLTIPNVLPGWFDMQKVKDFDIGGYTFVPLISELHTEAQRRYYTQGREDMELWTYTCTQPVYPYPTGHIDDYTLGFRLTSWMCFDYDFDAFLYWASVNYNSKEFGEVYDPWDTMATGFGRPGESRYFYPGERYGLDNPCPSLRAMAYRDGVDDYSLLDAVDEIYSEHGLDANVALQDVFNQVYSGAIPITDSYKFEDVRRQVFDMIGELKSDVGVLYSDFTVDFDKASLTLQPVNEKAIIEVDGKEAKKDENGAYTFKFDLTKQTKFDFTVVCGKNEKEYTRTLLVGKFGVTNGFEDTTNVDSLIYSSVSGYEASVTDDKAFVKDGEKSIHLVLNKDKADELPYFAIMKESELIGGTWEGMNSFKFYIFNAGTEEVEMNATYYTTGETTVATINLIPGEWTLAEIAMPQGVDVETISEFDFNFAQGSAVDLYIDSFATVVEGE